MMMFWGPNLHLSFRLLISPEHLSIDLASSYSLQKSLPFSLYLSVCLTFISCVQNKVEIQKPNEMHQNNKCTQEAHLRLQV